MTEQHRETEISLGGMEENEVRIDLSTEELRFAGSLIASDGEHKLYLTEGDVLVFVGEQECSTQDCADVTTDDLEPFFRDHDAYAGACEQLGLKRITYL